MKNGRWVVVPVLFACSAGMPAVALAEKPTFNCAKAQVEVEKLLCNDASLAALDQKLDKVYKAASAKASGKLAAQLRAEQRGWVKGRNDCWKAKEKTWITANWTVDSVKGCVDAQYRLRTSELQSVWRLMPPKTVSYACQNNPANEVVANFFETDPPTIRLERGDRIVTLWRVGAPGDGHYEGQNVSLEQKVNELKLSWLNKDTAKTDELQCKAR